jgi:hypothetical protein
MQCSWALRRQIGRAIPIPDVPCTDQLAGHAWNTRRSISLSYSRIHFAFLFTRRSILLSRHPNTSAGQVASTKHLWKSSLTFCKSAHVLARPPLHPSATPTVRPSVRLPAGQLVFVGWSLCLENCLSRQLAGHGGDEALPSGLLSVCLIHLPWQPPPGSPPALISTRFPGRLYRPQNCGRAQTDRRRRCWQPSWADNGGVGWHQGRRTHCPIHRTPADGCTLASPGRLPEHSSRTWSRGR